MKPLSRRSAPPPSPEDFIDHIKATLSTCRQDMELLRLQIIRLERELEDVERVRRADEEFLVCTLCGSDVEDVAQLVEIADELLGGVVSRLQDHIVGPHIDAATLLSRELHRYPETYLERRAGFGEIYQCLGCGGIVDVWTGKEGGQRGLVWMRSDLHRDALITTLFNLCPQLEEVVCAAEVADDSPHSWFLKVGKRRFHYHTSLTELVAWVTLGKAMAEA